MYNSPYVKNSQRLFTAFTYKIQYITLENFLTIIYPVSL